MSVVTVQYVVVK